MRYLAASIVIAAAAAVYGLFSHGVYSYFMTYAFMIPLLAGAMPHLISAMKGADSAAAEKLIESRGTQLAVIATLTVGSLLKGALDIYGTTNMLLIAYPVIAAVIIAIAAAAALKKRNNY